MSTKPEVSKNNTVSMRLLNSLISAREQLARKLGESFGGRRNLYSTFGYTDEVTYTEMRQRYLRQDIVSRIVNTYPDAIWTRPPAIIDAEELSTKLWDLDAEISLYHYINRADRLAGIGQYSVLLLGFSDVTSNAEMETEVTGDNLKLGYVQAYGENDAEIIDFEDNATSPSFGMPKTYNIKLSVDKTSNQKTLRVHRSRILHLADCTLDSDVYGYPILKRVFNRLDDVEKTVGGSAEMFWLSGRKGMQVDVDKDTEFTEEHAKKLREELDDFGNDLQRYIRTRGVTIKDLGGQHINPEPVFNVIMSIISVATGIPQRIFIGSEQGKLASEQDRANWALRIDERRKLYAEPKIMRPLIARLQQYGVLPAAKYELQWPEAFRMSPLERAQTAAQQARAATNIARSMQDFAKPIEGVDFPMFKATATVSGGGGGFGKGLAAANTKDKTQVDDKKQLPNSKDKPTDKNAPAPNGKNDVQQQAPEPVVVPMEKIQLPRRELLSVEEGRAIIFARGELKTESKIDGVMD